MPFIKYILSRLTNTTAWIGVIGLVLLIFNMHTALAILFMLLFFLPEANFTDLFAGWTKEIKHIAEEDE